MIGNCTWRYALVNGVKTDIQDAVKGVHGICPLCGDELAPRKGTIRNWHWWHINGRLCDDWYEPKGEWHRAWQGQFDETRREVSLIKESQGKEFKHIADVYTEDECVIEFQYSQLSLSEITDRESFYGDMIWVVCGTRLNKDRLYGEELLRRDDFLSSEDGLRYLVLKDMKDCNQCWRNRDSLVFFDFYGEINKPSIGTDLLCLIPGEVEGARLLARVSQDDFLFGCRCGHIQKFIERFLNCKQSYVRYLEKIGYLDKSVSCALTVEPVAGWLIAHGHLTEIQVSLNGVGNIAVKGKCVIHLSSCLDSQSYWWSKRKFKNWGITEAILKMVPSESDLKLHLHEFIGVTSYIKHGKSEMVSLELCEFKWLKRRFKYVYGGQPMWRLSGDLRQQIEQQIYGAGEGGHRVGPR